MAWYPKAIRKVITAKNRSRMRWYRRVNLHVAVSEASSLFGYFNQKGIADSHFYVRKDGTVEQMVDTAYQAYADLEGNDATISIETQGGLRNAQGEKWTAAQVESLAQIYAWAVKTHGIPAKIAKDSIPTGTGSHGLSWHRLGIDGNFGGGILRGRVAGGMHYSKARGKVCPGNAKIRQVADVFARAQKYITGGGSPTPSTDWFDTVDKNEMRDLLREEASGVAREVWMYPVSIAAATKRYVGSDETNAVSLVRYAGASMPEGRNQHRETMATLAAQNAALKALADGQGADTEAIVKAVQDAVAEAVAGLDLEGSPDPQ